MPSTRPTIPPPGIRRHMVQGISLGGGGVVVPCAQVVARLGGSVITYLEKRDGGAVIDRVDLTTGEATSLATLEHGMRFVGAHVVIRDGLLAFTTDERIVHAFDLATNERVMREPLRSDRLLQLVGVGEAIIVTYVVETVSGPRTLLCRLDLRAGRLTEPELEIEAKASAVASHQVSSHAGRDAETEGKAHLVVISAEAASRAGPFGAKLTAIWERGQEPLIIPGAQQVSSDGKTLVLRSDHGTRRIGIGTGTATPTTTATGGRLDVQFTPPLHYDVGHELLLPTAVSRVVSSTFLLPERTERRNLDRIGRTIVESLNVLEERFTFASSALMTDVFTLGLERPDMRWRLGALGLTLRDPLAAWIASGADPSLVVFGELAVDAGSQQGTAHRLLAFYMYPERDEPTPPIVMVDPGTLAVTWVARDFDAFFYTLLHDAEKTQPTMVDTIIELLGRDASAVRPAIVEETPPPWFAQVHHSGNEQSTPPTPEALSHARAAMDLLLQERLLVAITVTDRRCDTQAIGRELRKVYEALKWPEHVRAVRRWATAVPR